MKKVSLKFLYIVIFLSVLGACAFKNTNKYTGPKGYDFSKPDKFNMPSSLLEISGIAFHHSSNDTIYSIQDEDGKLFRQKWDVKKQKNMKFGPKGDYEDLGIFDQTVFILKSNGTLYSFPFTEAVKESSDQVKERKHLVPKGEYEGLYADRENGKLYMLCKNCELDKKAKTLTGYVFDYDAQTDSLSAAASFKIDLSQLKKLDPKLKSTLRPSALARNPKTDEWFILSSTNKLLLVADATWHIKSVHHLNSSTFNQPEGIAFDQQQNLYISNEGDEVSEGNIIKFSYLPTAKK
uniref:SdiA-regulated domain-containing protein n=1 Tax=Pedobacter schmidteae TaxID=2201271 RepID=UPI000EB08FD4|nr:SdiA-regulated domain-containing protein [Pedobacter schmidteae]